LPGLFQSTSHALRFGRTAAGARWSTDAIKLWFIPVAAALSRTLSNARRRVISAIRHRQVRIFEKPSNPAVRLPVIMANRLPLEKQTGADLIYYNEAYQSFVMVQYKMMERGSSGPEFRWQPNDQLADEVKRMDGLLQELALSPQDNSPSSFRF